MWAAAVTDVDWESVACQRDRGKSMGSVAKGDRQSRDENDPTGSGVLGLRRFKSLCDLEIEASRIAGTDLWELEAPEL
jgi:hypothetical protein